ncbi:hypothetical protein JCM5296_000686 [Sporobolomyces johnsonii]
MSRSPTRTRRSKPTPTNSLILVLPPLLFSPTLLPLFHAHFGTYGNMLSWTALERLGRVLVVYEEADEATRAKQEMDGFVWEEEDERGESSTAGLDRNGVNLARDTPQPLRAFFGPTLPVPLPTSLSSTLLSVPALSKNFLISPPGSPPVGWEQIEEEAPNTQVWHEGDEPADGANQGTMTEKWADELVRALRFLSVESNADEDVADGELEHRYGVDEQPVEGTTQLILPPSSDTPRPAVVVSTPPVSAPQTPSQTATPPPGAARITAVKATIESMLGRKKSFGDLHGAATPGGLGSSLGGLAQGGGARITPTSRPPLGGDSF